MNVVRTFQSAPASAEAGDDSAGPGSCRGTGLLLASIEQKRDARAMQADAVLRIVKKKLRKAHIRIDREKARYRNVFLAYFELEARSANEEE
ncbi:MAG TPA: hypothetical protein VF200_03235 [Woeseiaceae bacterium]